jgi:hypothetical protein
MDEFNRVYDYMEATYGLDQVVIFKINGWETPILAQAFRVPYYPFFLYIAPNTPTCSPASYFNRDPRNYDNMIAWME